jgi:integrase
MTTFASQSLAFLDGLKNRKRDPVKPATLAVWTSYAKKIVGLVGDSPIESFENGAMRSLINRLCDEELNPRTIHGIVETAKRIIASAVDENGNELYPRRWNTEFLDSPAFLPTLAPSASRESIENAIKNSSAKYRTLIGLLGATGLRIGECLAVKIGDDGLNTCWDKESSIIHVRQSVWRGVLQRPKTNASVRSVDLCTEINAAIIDFASNRKDGFLFKSRTGTPLSAAVVYRHGLAGTKIAGAHSLRRYRATRLGETEGMPMPLIKFWLGHAGESMSEKYMRPGEMASRKEWCEKAGLGFSLSKC